MIAQRKKRVIRVADLFCGAGGTSTGVLRAADKLGFKVDLVAVNHWDKAIATHMANHPGCRTLCAKIENVDPREAVPSGKLDLLCASPECIWHSRARGGRPINDQRRSSAWRVLEWLERLDVKNVLIENVKEFADWGPVDSRGNPIKARRGEIFRAFLAAIEGMGYRVDYRVISCAYYGDPQDRHRLFIRARKGRNPITWPEPTNLPPGDDLFSEGKQTFATARSHVIDFSIPGKSIFNRKKPLSKNTLKRIEAGLKKFGGEAAEPFLVVLRGTQEGQISTSHRSIDKPLPAVTAGGGHFGVVEPFICSPSSGGAPRSLDKPVPTLVTTAKPFLVQSFILNIDHTGGGDSVRSIDRPLPTQTTKARSCLVSPFLVTVNHGERTGQDARAHSIDKPMRTVTTSRGEAIVTPFLTNYYGNGAALSIDEPLDTVTCKDRFALVQPVGVDIHFRMLTNDEIARAQGFPPGYKFTGTKKDVTCQIGNAVPCNTAAALAGEILKEYVR